MAVEHSRAAGAREAGASRGKPRSFAARGVPACAAQPPIGLSLPAIVAAGAGLAGPQLTCQAFARKVSGVVSRPTPAGRDRQALNIGCQRRRE